MIFVFQGAVLQREVAAERFDALAHAPQPVAFTDERMLAVVFDQQAAAAALGDETQAAILRAGVAHDVGHGFAQRECEHGFFSGRKAEQCSTETRR